MIRIPREVEKTMKVMAEKGFEVYATGLCVRDALIGEKPIDWDLSTDACGEDLLEMFPEGKLINRGLHILRLEFEPSGEEEEGIIIDINHYRAGRELVNSLEEDLKARDFTCDSLAESLDRKLVDFTGGKSDIDKKLVRPCSRDLFVKDPVQMIKAIRYAAELGFDIPMETYDAIVAHKDYLADVDAEKIRDELILLIDGSFAGKGLKMLSAAQLMAYVIGEKCANHATGRETKDFNILCENIDRIKHVPERRLGLLFICFSARKSEEAITRLKFDEDTETKLLDAIYDLPKIYFIKNKIELKTYVAEKGLERYEYLHNLSKAQRIVYDLDDVKIQSRNYLWKDIIYNGEPVFVSDLLIDADDLINAGIAKDEEQAEQLLRWVLDVAHRTVKSKLTREFLMNKAKEFSKSKLKAKMRNLKWSR